MKIKKRKECWIALVSNTLTNFEKAYKIFRFFMFKPPRLRVISNNIDLLVAFPITKELQIYLSPDGFDVQWSSYLESRICIKTTDSTFYNEIINLISTFSLYQREPFMQGSASHQWIWYYEEGIFPGLKIVPDDVERDFRNRATIQLLPQHYGREGMENYVKQQLKKRESEYISNKEIEIAVYTWNTAGMPPKESIIPLILCAAQGGVCSEGPELLIVALQEICPLNAKNILGDENRKNKWMEFIVSEANLAYPIGGYKCIASSYLVGLLLVVLCKNTVAGSIDKIRETSVKVGLRGYAGNKGAVCVRFEVLNSSFCIVNCHLAAHKGKVRLRNKNIKSILQQASFTIDRNILKISEHDHIYWTGDMNYRISTLTYQEILEKIYAEDLQGLSQYDQLLTAKAENGVLVDFFEGPLAFPPTFKVIMGTFTYK